MNAATITEIVSTVAVLLGSGTVGVSKLTRIAVAAEELAKDIRELAGQQKETQTQVTDHENRLNRGGL